MTWTINFQIRLIYGFSTLLLLGAIALLFWPVSYEAVEDNTVIADMPDQNNSTEEWINPFAHEEDVTLDPLSKLNETKPVFILRGVGCLGSERYAIVELDHKQKFLKCQEAIAGWRLKQVGLDDAEFCKEDQVIQLKMSRILVPEPMQEMPQNKSYEKVVDRNEINRPLIYWEKVLREVHPIPFFQSGVPVGFLLTDVHENNLLKSIGFRNGDILKSVNGQAIASREHVFQMFSQLINAQEIIVHLNRDARDIDFVFHVKN